jgi:hypothetical protein
MRFTMKEIPARPAFSIGQPEKPPDLAAPASDLRLAVINLLPEHPLVPPLRQVTDLASARAPTGFSAPSGRRSFLRRAGC